MFLAIVPAYNEEDSIGSVVRGLFRIVDRVVVVDDGSVDNTKDEAVLSGAVVIRHEINRGQGAALETGHEYARSVGADYVLHFDADGQFDVADILPALQELKNKSADVLFGSRFLDSRSSVPFLKRFIILPLARLFNNFFVGIQLSDAHNGFRIINKKALHKINILQDRMAHATEILAQIKANDLSYVEWSVKVTYLNYGQKFSGGFKIITDLFLAKFL